MSTLTGRRVLIAEDELLVGLDIKATLQRVGCDVFGPFAKLRDAATALTLQRPDAAVLDINLAGEKVFPLADALARKGVPFLFVTAYSNTWIPHEYRNRTIVAKPFFTPVIIGAIGGLLR